MPEMLYFIRHSSSDFHLIKMELKWNFWNFLEFVEFLEFFGTFGIFCLKIPYLEFTTPIISRVSPLEFTYHTYHTYGNLHLYITMVIQKVGPPVLRKILGRIFWMCRSAPRTCVILIPQEGKRINLLSFIPIT
jgi:hypothetical protein